MAPRYSVMNRPAQDQSWKDERGHLDCSVPARSTNRMSHLGLCTTGMQLQHMEESDERPTNQDQEMHPAKRSHDVVRGKASPITTILNSSLSMGRWPGQVGLALPSRAYLGMDMETTRTALPGLVLYLHTTILISGLMDDGILT